MTDPPRWDELLDGAEILCLGNQRWQSHWTTKHEIITRLAKHTRVVYINRPRTIAAALRRSPVDLPVAVSCAPSAQT